MQFDIIGGGSIGLLYGARLAEAGADVTIWTRSEEQASMLLSNGIALRELDGASERIVKVRSRWSRDAANLSTPSVVKNRAADRWILLTVKQTDLNEELLDQLAHIAAYGGHPAAAVICLQNGIGHLEKLQNRLLHTPLIAAVTTEGAKRLDGRSVEHTGKGQLFLAEWTENQRKQDDSFEIAQKMLVNMLQSAGFTIKLSNDIDNRIFSKLLINAVINPLTAIFDVTNGELPNHSTRENLMRALYGESEKILRAAGMTTEIDGWQQIIEVCKLTSGNVSSMLSDIRAGKETEISAINGGIVRLAESCGLEAPLNKAIIELVQALHPKLS